MSEALISFVIPHKGREQFLIQTLESISLQEFDLSTVEVILVTQNEDISNEILEFKPVINLSVFTQPVEESISALRNFGVKNSTGEYVAFLDADVYLSSNWIQCMLDKLNEIDSRVITSAVQINSSDAPPLEKIRTALSNASTDSNVNFLPGRNLFLSRETFQKVGGFPVHLITCEDYYFTDKANNLGDLYYTSEASYIHLGEDKDFFEMYKKEIWRGQSNLLSIKGRSIPLNEIPSFVVPITLLLFFILLVVTLITSQFILALLFFIAILIPVSVYTSRLFLLTKNSVSLSDVVKFYLYYFPARAIGTIGGVFKTFSSRSHR
jgi:GT2 family glycosyltransferase